MPNPENVGEEVADVQEKEAEELEKQDSDTGVSAEKEETFFDASKLTPELLPAYKNMQAAFTRKMQKLAIQDKEWQSQREQRENVREPEPEPEIPEGPSDYFSDDPVFQRFTPDAQSFVRWLDGHMGRHVGELREELLREQRYKSALYDRHTLESKYGKEFTAAIPELSKLVRTGRFHTLSDAFEYYRDKEQLKKLEVENKQLRTKPSAASVGRESASGIPEDFSAQIPRFRNIEEAAAWAQKNKGR